MATRLALELFTKPVEEMTGWELWLAGTSVDAEAEKRTRDSERKGGHGFREVELCLRCDAESEPFCCPLDLGHEGPCVRR